MPSGFVGPGIIAFSMIDPTPYSGATWTIADGKAISRIAFPILFAAFGTLYGPGDGSTTYNIPDLRGRTPIATAPAGLAWSAAAKTVGNGYGEETVTLAATQIPSHTHGAGTLAAASAGGKSVAATALLLLSSGPNIAQGRPAPARPTRPPMPTRTRSAARLAPPGPGPRTTTCRRCCAAATGG